MLGVSIADSSELFNAILKKQSCLPIKCLPLLLVFIGIMNSIASGTGCFNLNSAAELLYERLGKNPLIKMATSFADVSTGFTPT